MKMLWNPESDYNPCYIALFFYFNFQADIKIGQREGMSEIDLEKVGFIYAGECVERNKDYLLKTCPSVVKSEPQDSKVSQKDIADYFKNRLWPFGIVNYKMRDKMEFCESRTFLN